MSARTAAPRRTLVSLLGLLLVPLILLAACGDDSSEPEAGDGEESTQPGDAGEDEELPKIRLGISHLSAAFMATYVADAEGLFAEAGVEVEVVPFNGGPLAIQALLADEIDVFEGDFTPILSTYGEPGADLVVFAETNSTPVYRLQSMAPSIEELMSSSPVGGVSAIGGIDHIIAQYMLTELGYDADSVDFRVAGTPAERAQAMIADHVDFVAGSTPGSFSAEDQGANSLATLSDVVESFPLESFATTREYYDANQDILDKLIAGQQAGSEWLRANPDGAVDIVMDAVGADAGDRDLYVRTVEDAAPYLGGTTAPALSGPSMDGYEMIIDFYISQGQLEATREDVLSQLFTWT